MSKREGYGVVSGGTGVCMTKRHKVINSTVIHRLRQRKCVGVAAHARTRLSLAQRRTIRGFFTRRGPRCIFLTTTGMNNVVTGRSTLTSFVCSGVVLRVGIVRTT